MFLNLIDNAPASLDTLNELANELGDDYNFAAWVRAQLDLKSNYIICRYMIGYEAPTAIAYIRVVYKQANRYTYRTTSRRR